MSARHIKKEKTAALRLSDCQFFFDFDNTIVPFDVLDDIIKRFSINREWVKLEKEWKAGKIGSRECLQGQLGLVRIQKERFLRYLSKIRLDPYFGKVLNLLRRNKVKTAILSDDFSYIIKYILKNNGIRRIKVYSNRLKLVKDRFSLGFPHTNRTCALCGHCKRNNLLKNVNGDKMLIYVGDGYSDVCPAQEADVVFAKGNLLRHLQQMRKSCKAIRDLKDVYDYCTGIVQ
jgi:2,3-diketo-5-methylthio-1-phosphopentane phosphatase